MKVSTAQRAVWSWCLYDWANSAFALTVMAAFFPAFFNKYWNPGVDSAIITFRLGMGNTVAGLCVALVSPVFGVMAGIGKTKKQFLASSIFLGTFMTAALFFVGKGEWLTALIVFILARIGFATANLFYDAYLLDVAQPGQRDLVSSQGYAIGYLGCAILFTINILMYLKPAIFGLRSPVDGIRYSFLSAAVWWLLFSIPILAFVHEKPAPRGAIRFIESGTRDLRDTIIAIIKDKNLLLFLVAFWCYFDGVHTIVVMAKNFGISLGLPYGTLMAALLCVQLVAFPSALLFGYCTRWIGSKLIILVSICFYIFITLGGAWILRTSTQYFIFASLTGMVQGAIQALSRSFFTRMIPVGKESEYFGIFNMVGRFSVVLGPALVGISNLVCFKIGLNPQTASRAGISSLSLLFFAGGLILARVRTITNRA
jgi:UMF1 family MFS transporter